MAMTLDDRRMTLNDASVIRKSLVLKAYDAMTDNDAFFLLSALRARVGRLSGNSVIKRHSVMGDGNCQQIQLLSGYGFKPNASLKRHGHDGLASPTGRAGPSWRRGLRGVRPQSFPRCKNTKRGAVSVLSEVETCTARELGELLGVTDRTVRGLATGGQVVRVSTGRYAVAESVKRYCEHLRMVAAGRGGEAEALDLSRERARLAAEQADAQALKNGALRGDLVEASAVQAEWAGVLRSVRSGVLAVVSRVRQQLPHLTAHEAEVIDREIRAALTALGKGEGAADDL